MLPKLVLVQANLNITNMYNKLLVVTNYRNVSTVNYRSTDTNFSSKEKHWCQEP